MVTAREPRTLLEAVKFFSDKEFAFEFMVGIRWPNGPACPRCGDARAYFLKSRKVWKCKGCQKHYTVKLGTIFEDSPIALEKWLPAMWLIANCKNGISSHELARALGVTQKTAWFMLSRLRLGLQDDQTGGKLSGSVEIDETFIGGKARNMHANKRKRVIAGNRGGTSGKVAVMGLLQRHGGDGDPSKVRLHIVEQVRRDHLMPHIDANVAPLATVITDTMVSYAAMPDSYAHKVINHAERYVDGQVHTNSIENFWSLLKRTLHGTYVAVEPFHLFRYLDEQAWRFNNRKLSDRSRFIEALKGVIGKRLTYDVLTGSGLPETC